LHAQHDEIASLNNQAFVAKHVEAGVFSSVVYKNSYHMLTIDRDRYILFQDVIEFLKRLEVHRPD
jgi:esterase/lipase